MHAKPDLRVVLKWKIFRSGSVITAVIRLGEYMFTNACTTYRNLLCQVGVGSSSVNGRLFGSGCLISDQHILTARHVVRNVPIQFDWPVVLIHSGLHKCEILFESAPHDLMILRVIEQISESSHPAPIRYPVFPTQSPTLGMSAGHLARLSLETENGDRTSRNYFSTSVISMITPCEPNEKLTFVLAGGIAQGGFSGCPVFGADLTLLGTLIQCYQFPIHSDQQLTQIHSLPVMSPTFPVMSDVQSALENVG